MYPNHGYATMIADRIRTDAYVRAIQSTVRDGSVVVEIGTGVGFFAIVAARRGAARVYAFETSPAIFVAQKIAEVNGSPPIQFIHADAKRIQLTERADVIISDLRGALPPFEAHFPTIIDARQRFLSETGVLVPKRDVLCAALVEAERHYSYNVGIWSQISDDINLEPARSLETTIPHKTVLNEGQLLSDAREWAILDYMTMDRPFVQGGLQLQATRAGTCHGIAVWFDTVLCEGVGFSNHPSRPAVIYGQTIFPFMQPFQVSAGDKVEAVFSTDVVESTHVWRWRGTTPAGEFDQCIDNTFGSLSASHALRTVSLQAVV